MATPAAPTRASVYELAHAVLQCSRCFSDGCRRHAVVDVPQPYYVPDGYYRSRPRILLICRNPGTGAARKDGADRRCREILRDIRSGIDRWNNYLRWNQEDVVNWGAYKKMLDALGLEMTTVSLGNIAMCAVQDSEDFHQEMAVTCGFNHLRRSLETLAPSVVILVGGTAAAWHRSIRTVLPKAMIESVRHYAAHGTWESKEKAYTAVRDKIAHLVRDHVSGF